MILSINSAAVSAPFSFSIRALMAIAASLMRGLLSTSVMRDASFFALHAVRRNIFGTCGTGIDGAPARSVVCVVPAPQ